MVLLADVQAELNEAYAPENIAVPMERNWPAFQFLQPGEILARIVLGVHRPTVWWGRRKLVMRPAIRFWRVATWFGSPR